MKIWWCEAHDSGFTGEEDIEWCKSEHIPYGHKCGERQLVPEGALVIEKVDGDWPSELLRKASQRVIEDLMARQRLAESTGSTFWLDPEMTVRACVVALASQVAE